MLREIEAELADGNYDVDDGTDVDFVYVPRNLKSTEDQAHGETQTITSSSA